MRTRAVVVGILLFGAACGGDDPPTVADGGGDTTAAADGGEADTTAAGGGGVEGEGLDACRFVTAEEAEALLGGDPGTPVQVQTPAVGDINPAQACTYNGAGGSIQIVSTTLNDEADFVADQNAEDIGAEEVDGVGDQAIITDGAFSSITVRVGLDTVGIYPNRADDQQITRDQLLELGRTAAERF